MLIFPLYQNPVAITIPFSWIKGANVSGIAQYPPTQLPLVNGTNGFIPTQVDVEYLADKGFNTVRFMVSQELLQVNLAAPNNVAFTEFAPVWQQVKQSIQRFIDFGFYVIIARHEGADDAFGKFNGNYITANGGTNPSWLLADFWTRMAREFMNNEYVGFSLDNEPLLDSNGTYNWWKIAQDCIDSIRATGSGQAIFVNGVSYTAASSWSSIPWHSVDPAAIKRSNADGFLSLTDPCDNLVACIHSYFSAADTGADDDVVSPIIGRSRLANVIEWSNNNFGRNIKVLIEELGSKASATNSPENIANYDDYMRSYARTYDYGPIIGSCWWTYAPYTPGWSSYDFTLTTQGGPPPGGTDSPQMNMLESSTFFNDIYEYEFTPADIPNRIMHFTADDSVVVGGKVDKLNNSQGDATKDLISRTDSGFDSKPDYIASDSRFRGQPVVRGSSSGTYASAMSTATFAAITTPITMYIVCRREELQTFVWSGGPTMTSAGFKTNSAAVYSYSAFAATADSSTSEISAPFPINETCVICVVFNGASSSINRNSYITSASGNTGSLNMTGYSIGTVQWTKSDKWYFAEMVSYSGAHDLDTRSKILTYYSKKYNAKIIQ